MKIAILGDTHFGSRNDHQAFHDYFEKFYNDVFFPTLKERGITEVIQLGDLFDRRKYVNFYTLKRSKEYFFDKLVSNEIYMHVFVGNHDTYFKNTNEVNSPELLLQDYKNRISVYSEPTDISIGLECLKVTLLPWVCSGNYEQCMQHISQTNAQILFGHLELAGFEMHRGAVNDHGMDVKPFDKFDMVISGHYHHKSSKGNIHYTGTPYEMTWSDYNDPKGFHIFDTETRELEFIQNPYNMFQKWFYNDESLTLEEINDLPFEKAKDSFVKIVVKNKNNPYWFDLYVNKFEKAGALDIQVVDDNLNLQLEDDESIIDEAEDTLTILKNYASQVSSTVDTGELNKFLTDLYAEALTVE